MADFNVSGNFEVDAWSMKAENERLARLLDAVLATVGEVKISKELVESTAAYRISHGLLPDSEYISIWAEKL